MRIVSAVRDNRFIPAGAGNTAMHLINKLFHTVYPRWRGEHITLTTARHSPGGLSPLARGTRRFQPRQLWVFRFIPAGAGNTFIRYFVISVRPVYPRWRGEHAPLTASLAVNQGLSPLARGTPGVDQPQPPPSRFIPAGAGNTYCMFVDPTEPTVYPRWRGEHARGLYQFIECIGLSPLARGTLLAPLKSKPFWRFIPAGAGNTPQHTARHDPKPVYPRWRGEHFFASCT